MDAKGHVSLKTGEKVKYLPTGHEYLVTYDKGATMATRTIFLSSHELQTRGWLMMDLQGEFVPIDAAGKITVGSKLKQAGQDEVFVVIGQNVAVIAMSVGRFVTKPEDWELVT